MLKNINFCEVISIFIIEWMSNKKGNMLKKFFEVNFSKETRKNFFKQIYYDTENILTIVYIRQLY